MQGVGRGEDTPRVPDVRIVYHGSVLSYPRTIANGRA
jgi:hypothetical protein